MPKDSSAENRDVEMAGVDTTSNDSGDEVSNHVMTNGHAQDEFMQDNEDMATAQVEAETAASSLPENEQPLPSVEDNDKNNDDDNNSDDSNNDDINMASTATGKQANLPMTEDKAGVPLQPTPSASASIKHAKEIARLEEAMSDVSPKAAQEFLRSHWRQFLFQGYDEDHISFVLRALLKNGNKNILNRVMKDETIFKEPLLGMALSRKLSQLTPAEIIRFLPEHLLADAISEKAKSSVTNLIIDKLLQIVTADQIANFTPTEVLNRVLAEGIRDASAKNLLTWMSDANRLGFKADDKLDDDDESVEPNEASVPVHINGNGQGHMAHTPILPPPNRNHISPYPLPAYMPVNTYPAGFHPPSGYPQLGYPPQSGYSLHPNHPVQQPAQQPVQPAARLTSQPHFANPNQDPLLVEQERNFQEQRIAQQSHKLQQQAEKISQKEAQERQQSAEAAQKRRKDEKRRSEADVRRDEAIRAAAQQASSGPPWICTDCDQTMPTCNGYSHHRAKMPCRKPPPDGWANWKKFWCDNCCSGFTQAVGLTYHNKNKVCFRDPDAPKGSAPAPPSSLPPADAPNGYYPRPNASPARRSLHTSNPVGRPPSTQESSSRTRIIPPSKPPLSTPSYPASKLDDVTNFRVSPSDLPPEKLAQMDQEIRDADDKYEKKLAELPANLTEEARSAKLFSYKNQYTTQKSAIRKKYGVSLRLRDKDKKGRQSLGLDTPSQKRKATDSSPLAQPSQPLHSFSPINPPGRGTFGVLTHKRQRTESERSPAPGGAQNGSFIPHEYDPASHKLNRKPVAPQGGSILEAETSNGGANERTRDWISGAGAAENPMVVEDDSDSDASIPAEPTAKSGAWNGLRKELLSRGSTEEESAGSDGDAEPAREVIRSSMGDIIRR